MGMLYLPNWCDKVSSCFVAIATGESFDTPNTSPSQLLVGTPIDEPASGVNSTNHGIRMTGPSHRIFRAEVSDLVRSGAPAARPALARRLALCGVLSLATLTAAAAPPILDNIPDQTVIQDHPT